MGSLGGDCGGVWGGGLQGGCGGVGVGGSPAGDVGGLGGGLHGGDVGGGGVGWSNSERERLESPASSVLLFTIIECGFID